LSKKRARWKKKRGEKTPTRSAKKRPSQLKSDKKSVGSGGRILGKGEWAVIKSDTGVLTQPLWSNTTLTEGLFQAWGIEKKKGGGNGNTAGLKVSASTSKRASLTCGPGTMQRKKRSVETITGGTLRTWKNKTTHSNQHGGGPKRKKEAARE